MTEAADITAVNIEVAGVPTHLLRGGEGPRDILFLHGAVPGVTPYCGGIHIWDGTLERFAPGNRVWAIDMLGSGRTGYPGTGAPLTIDQLGEHVLAALIAQHAPALHIVAHDMGALVALWLVANAPDRVLSVCIVASALAAPSIDTLDDIVLLDPPGEFGSRVAQYWAMDRISYTPHHIGQTLLDACVEAAGREGPRKAREVMASAISQAQFLGNVTRNKYANWTLARTKKMPVPIQLIWGTHDPLASVEGGLLLFKTLAQNQPQAQYHQVNRSGSFIFREKPEQFLRLASAFHEGLENTSIVHRYA